MVAVAVAKILIMFNMNKIKNEGGTYGQILCGDSVNECELWKCRSCGWGEIINSAADATNTRVIHNPDDTN